MWATVDEVYLIFPDFYKLVPVPARPYFCCDGSIASMKPKGTLTHAVVVLGAILAAAAPRHGISWIFGANFGQVLAGTALP